MKSIKRQNGMTGLGWLTVLALIGFFSLLTIKLVPIYLEHYSIKTILLSLKEEPLITKKSPQEIRTLLKRRLKVNGVYDLDKNAITIKKSTGVLKVDITYEIRKNMAGNIDVLVHFSDNVEMVSN
jgi:hypothetical protein